MTTQNQKESLQKFYYVLEKGGQALAIDEKLETKKTMMENLSNIIESNQFVRFEKNNGVCYITTSVYCQEPTKSLKESFEDLLRITCREMGVAEPDVICKTRKREPTDARKILMTYMKERYPSCSLKYIGWLFSDRDHSTVLNAKNKFIDLCSTQKQFRGQAQNCFAQMDMYLGMVPLEFKY